MEDFVAFKRMDGLGRVVIPKDFRRYFGISENDFVKLVPTENGILAEASLGISDIQIDAETLAPILILALDIPKDTTSTEKTLSIQVLSDTSDTPSTVIFDQTITFTRASTSGHFTAEVSCPSPTTIGSTRYLIRAYN
jgi:bifunctional DNA-binding transcriptional regulator/antitoxin component of YhaV-PrlF toxin-antitoxin module